MRMLYFLTILLGAFATILHAQPKGDYNWMLGSDYYDPANNSGGTHIDFNTIPPQISIFNSSINLYANTSISGDDGELLFYTNGCFVANRNYDIMPHGDSINAGFSYTQWCIGGDGYPSHQGLLALPFPGSDHLYVIIHFKNADIGVHDHNELLYSIVDMDLEGGLGDVTIKNQQIFQHDFFYDQLTAVRHGNGRDWWILVPERGDSNKYFLFLLSPQGFSGPFIQVFGFPGAPIQGGSQACFSPDGKKYIRMYPQTYGGQVADFDRCTGLLSNPKQFFVDGVLYACGCAVSPNNRFMYISAYKKMYQFDLQASDLQASRILLDTFDGAFVPLPAHFFQAMNAPDGKIYFTSSNSVNALHVVHHPNEAGLACDFEQHSIELPALIDFPIPNFPHFRLLDQQGSICDTLGINGSGQIDQPAVLGPLRLLPNPIHQGDILRIEAGNPFSSKDRLLIYDLLGKNRFETEVPPSVSNLEIEIGPLEQGIYFVVLLRSDGTKQKARLVVVRAG